MKFKKLLNLAVILGVSAACATAGWERAEAQVGTRKRVLDRQSSITLKEIYGINGATQARKAAGEIGDTCSLHIDLANSVASCLPLARDKKFGFKLCQLQMSGGNNGLPSCTEVKTLRHVNVLVDANGSDKIEKVTVGGFKKKLKLLERGKVNTKDGGTKVQGGDLGSVDIIAEWVPFENLERDSSSSTVSRGWINPYGGRGNKGQGAPVDMSATACEVSLDQADSVQKKAARLAGVLKGKVAVLSRRYNVKCVNVDESGQVSAPCKSGQVYNADSTKDNKCEACPNPSIEVVQNNACISCKTNEVVKDNKCVVDNSDKNSRRCSNPVDASVLFDCKDASNYAEKYNACQTYLTSGANEDLIRVCKDDFSKKPSFFQRFVDVVTSPVDGIVDPFEDMRENRPDSAADAVGGARAILSRIAKILNPLTWVNSIGNALWNTPLATNQPPKSAAPPTVTPVAANISRSGGSTGSSAGAGGGATQPGVPASKPTYGNCKDGEVGCLCVETLKYIDCNSLNFKPGQSDSNCQSGVYDFNGNCKGG
jgi:hypothetical protein